MDAALVNSFHRHFIKWKVGMGMSLVEWNPIVRMLQPELLHQELMTCIKVYRVCNTLAVMSFLVMSTVQHTDSARSSLASDQPSGEYN